MWFIGVQVEQETSAPRPKKNPGSVPGLGTAGQCFQLFPTSVLILMSLFCSLGLM